MVQVLENGGERQRMGEHGALLCQLLSPRAWVRASHRVASARTRLLVDRSHIPVERHLQLWHSQCRLGPSAGSRIVRYLSCDVASTKNTQNPKNLASKKQQPLAEGKQHQPHSELSESNGTRFSIGGAN